MDMNEMSEHEQRFLKMQQGMEQLSETLRQLVAPTVAAYYGALRDGGVGKA